MLVGSRIWRGYTVLLLATLMLRTALTESDSIDEDAFRECSSHCRDEHEGERYEKMLCVELCRLFDFPEPATMD